jgi:thiamine pyrophosphate-dependent acetolactate synthase large subunit-like protein
MKLRDCFEFIAGRWADEIVITSAGNASEMWWDVTRETERVFYLEASMSLASMFAAGIARGIPAAKVWCFSGDGAFCMNPGMLMVERQMGLPNLKHFLVSNRTYGSTHDVPLANRADNDYQAIARGMGLANVQGFGSLAELEAGFDRVVRANGHAFSVLEVEPVGEKIPSPPLDGPECKFRFGRYLERTFGVRVFSDQI